MYGSVQTSKVAKKDALKEGESPSSVRGYSSADQGRGSKWDGDLHVEKKKKKGEGLAIDLIRDVRVNKMKTCM